jgi:hypothetical protein
LSEVGLTVPVICKQVPVTVTVPQSTGPQALLVLNESVPLCGPDVVQVSRTVTVTLPPGGTVTGSAGLTTLKAGLLELMALIVNAPLPVLLTVKIRSAVAPTHTWPKSRSRGLTSQVINRQVPLTLTVPQSTGPQTLDVTKLIVPDWLPGVVQVNRTVTGTDKPAGTVTGSAGLTMLNAGLLETMALIVKSPLPVLFTVKLWLALWPTQTLPKLRLAGDTAQVINTQVPLTLTVPQETGPHTLLVLNEIVPDCAPDVAQVKRTVTPTLPPGGMVTGKAGLTTLNAALLELMALIVNGRLPVLLTVKLWSALWPTQTLPKLRLAGDTAQVICTQKPLTATVPQETGPQALLVLNEITPLWLPGVVQVNRTVTVTLPPAGTDTGNAGLTMLNAGLLELMPSMLNAALPVLLTVKVRLALWPTQTSSKSSAVGDTLQVMSKHVPLTATVPHGTGPQTLLVTKLTWPLCAPGVVQVNRTVTTTLPPAGTTVGSAGPVMLNAPLLELMAVIVKSALPVLLTVKLWSALWPTQTLPKSRLVGDTAHTGWMHVPLTLTTPRSNGQLVALLVVKDMTPDCGPEVAQVNVTVNVALSPGLMVTPPAGATLNAGLLELTAVMVNGRFPVLVTTKFWLALWPTHTWPKLMLRGFTSPAILTQKPLTGTGAQSGSVVQLPDGSVTKLMSPSCDPPVVQVNRMLAVSDEPGATVAGKGELVPATVNAGLLETMALTMNAPLPVLLMVMG